MYKIIDYIVNQNNYNSLQVYRYGKNSAWEDTFVVCWKEFGVWFTITIGNGYNISQIITKNQKITPWIKCVKIKSIYT